MIYEELDEKLISRLMTPRSMGNEPEAHVIMVEPTHFDILYSINAHMTHSDGSLKRVDSILAQNQWANLKAAFESVGTSVTVLPGLEGLPDMVFCANTSFVWKNTPGSENHVIASQMASKMRQPEVQPIMDWYKTAGYKVHTFNDPRIKFEGTGDALWVSDKNLLVGGYGFRSDRAAYDELSDRFGIDVVPVKLVSEHCYHLDTALAVIGPEVAVIDFSAFDEKSKGLLRQLFPRFIEIPSEDNLKYFVCNLFSPNGHDVILHRGAHRARALLEQAGLNVVEVDVSEYLKAGGAVFCMKMTVY